MRPARGFLVLVLCASLGGCLEEPRRSPLPTLEIVDAPEDGGGFAACGSNSAESVAVPFTARVTMDAEGNPPGIHRLDASRFLWVYSDERDSLREDRITRLNEVEVRREPTMGDPPSRLVICTRVELDAPQEVDGERRSLVVAAVFEATSGLPAGHIRFVVNWVASCLCDPLPRGNVTAEFAVS